jgi:hypothetical protein
MDNDQLLENKSTYELIESLLREAAKASAEIRCANQDIRKVENRLGFTVLLINVLLDRLKQEADDQR